MVAQFTVFIFVLFNLFSFHTPNELKNSIQNETEKLFSSLAKEEQVGEIVRGPNEIAKNKKKMLLKLIFLFKKKIRREEVNIQMQ